MKSQRRFWLTVLRGQTHPFNAHYRYPVRATSEQEDAVALLMNDVGVASFMQYTPNASVTQGIFAYQAHMIKS